MTCVWCLCMVRSIGLFDSETVCRCYFVRSRNVCLQVVLFSSIHVSRLAPACTEYDAVSPSPLLGLLPIHGGQVYVPQSPALVAFSACISAICLGKDVLVVFYVHNYTCLSSIPQGPWFIPSSWCLSPVHALTLQVDPSWHRGA